MDKDKVIQKMEEYISYLKPLASDDGFKPDEIDRFESELSVLKSAKEEVKSAEEILKEKIIALPNGNIEDWEDGNKEHPDVLKALIKAMHEYASQFQSVQSKEVQLFMDDVHQWADSAFGKERTALAPVYHLKKEVDEVISEMKKGFPGLAIKELADCFILVLNATSKYGYSFDKLFTEAKDKMIINKTRKWGKPDENGVCEHIKDQPVQSVKGEGERTAEEELPYNRTIFIRAKNLDYALFCEWFNTIRKKLESYKHSESKDMYPKEFVEWKDNNVTYCGDGMYLFPEKGSSLDDVYQHWSSNNK